MKLLRALQVVVASALLAAAGAVSAQDAGALAVGAVVPGNVLKIGARTYELPAPQWTVAARNVRTVRLNELQGGAEVIELILARIVDGQVRAALVFIGPTAPTKVNAWREDPSCKAKNTLLFEDASTVRFPECMIVQVFNGMPLKVEGAEVFSQAAAFYKERGLKLPSPVLRVSAIRYDGDEYLRITGYFDAASFGLEPTALRELRSAPPAVEQWARALRAAVAKALGGVAGTQALPALP